jgi:hypothetical protein
MHSGQWPKLGFVNSPTCAYGKRNDLHLWIGSQAQHMPSFITGGVGCHVYKWSLKMPCECKERFMVQDSRQLQQSALSPSGHITSSNCLVLLLLHSCTDNARNLKRAVSAFVCGSGYERTTKYHNVPHG